MNELRKPCRWRSAQDEWILDGKKITSEENLREIRDAVENRDVIIVEHWLYNGASAPNRIIFEEFDEFLEYVDKRCSGGDALDIWLMHDVCTRENLLLEGKIPDEDGCVPRGGAY